MKLRWAAQKLAFRERIGHHSDLFPPSLSLTTQTGHDIWTAVLEHNVAFRIMELNSGGQF